VTVSEAESALVCITRFYYGGNVDVSSLKPGDSQTLIDEAVNYLTYINTLEVFYKIMGFLRIIFCILLLVYQVKRYYTNSKLSWFQVSVIWMIQVLSVL